MEVLELTWKHWEKPGVLNAQLSLQKRRPENLLSVQKADSGVVYSLETFALRRTPHETLPTFMMAHAVSLENSSVWKMSHVLYKESLCSHFMP